MRSKTIGVMLETCLFGVILLLGLDACATPEKTSTPTTQHITFEKDIHFLNEQAGDIIVDAGSYTVSHVPHGTESLQLVSSQQPGETSLVIDAIKGMHNETLAKPNVVSIGGEELHYLALLLPGGTGYEVMGSYSGVWPRGGVKEIANRQVFQFALQKEQQALDNLKQQILRLVKQGRLDPGVGGKHLKDLQAHQAAVSKNLKALTTQDRMALQSAMQNSSRVFQTLSNILKTIHDTQKSMINNIR